eukprot:34296-Chlamydomonas_euryale.AAC.3
MHRAAQTQCTALHPRNATRCAPVCSRTSRWSAVACTAAGVEVEASACGGTLQGDGRLSLARVACGSSYPLSSYPLWRFLPPEFLSPDIKAGLACKGRAYWGLANKRQQQTALLSLRCRSEQRGGGGQSILSVRKLGVLLQQHTAGLSLWRGHAGGRDCSVFTRGRPTESRPGASCAASTPWAANRKPPR